jgi:site-specific DNA recombinase
MSRIAYYVRVSTKDKQDYQYQIDSLDNYLKGIGIKANEGEIDIYSEKESGYKDDRPELNRLLNKLKEDNSYYSCVYVTEISRLGRNSKRVREALEVFKECRTNLFIKQLGISLLDDKGEVNHYGSLVLSIFIELSDAEARQAKDRFKNGILSGIMAGKAGGGNFIPYGFRKGDDKMLLIDEEEAEIVRLIFDLYKAGNGTKVIAGILNNKGILTRTNKVFGDKTLNSKTGKVGSSVIWVDKTVDDILQNPIYIGKRRYWGGKANRKNIPQLFDIAGETILNPITIFDECMEIRKAKTHKNHLTTYTYLLKDKLICGRCGRNYFAKFKPTLHGDKVYICSGRLQKKGNCGNVGLNISLLESVIFNEIVSADSILKHINSKDEIKTRLKQDIEKLQNTIETCQNKRITLERDINTAIDLQFEARGSQNKELAQRYADRINEYSNDIKNNANKLQNAESTLIKTSNAFKKRSTIETTSKQLKSYINDRVSLRSVFLQIIDKIVISSIDKDTVLADVYISLDGVVLPNSLKIFLDISGMRYKHKKYRYRHAVEFGFNLEYEANILKTPLSKLQELIFTLKENEGLNGALDLLYVPDRYILNIPIEGK